MSEEILTKCGYRCDLCLAYQPNVEKNDQRAKLSDGWFEIYGFRIPPEEILCEGCVSCDDPVLIDKECPVRPCVISRTIDNCAHCDEYICDKLELRIVKREVWEKKLGYQLSEMEYKHYVLPYESEPRLNSIRKKRKK